MCLQVKAKGSSWPHSSTPNEEARESCGFLCRILCNGKDAGFVATARDGTLCFSPLVLEVHVLW